MKVLSSGANMHLFFPLFQLLRQHYIAQYPEDGCRSRYPILMLSLTVSPSAVDVNLTPDKTQLLLHDQVGCKGPAFDSVIK